LKCKNSKRRLATEGKVVRDRCVHGTVNTAHVVNMLRSLFLRFRTLKIARGADAFNRYSDYSDASAGKSAEAS
jgi:hypothetical protein